MQTNIYDARRAYTFGLLRTAQMFSSHGNFTSAENLMQNYPV